MCYLLQANVQALHAASMQTQMKTKDYSASSESAAENLAERSAQIKRKMIVNLFMSTDAESTLAMNLPNI